MFSSVLQWVSSLNSYYILWINSNEREACILSNTKWIQWKSTRIFVNTLFMQILKIPSMLLEQTFGQTYKKAENFVWDKPCEYKFIN